MRIGLGIGERVYWLGRGAFGRWLFFAGRRSERDLRLRKAWVEVLA